MKSLIKLNNSARLYLIAIGLCLFLPLTIQAQLNPFPTYDNGETIVRYKTSNPGDVANGALSNRVIKNVLYTLDDDGTAESPDGYDSEHGLVINSTMTDEQMATVMGLTPGMDDYAAIFKGITILMPPGNGSIIFLTKYNDGHQLCVKVGNQDPKVFMYDDTSLFHPNHYDGYQCDTVEYALDVPTYVYIYHQNAPSQSRRMTRIGPKENVNIALDNLSVYVNAIDEPKDPPASPKQLTSADVAEAIANIPSTGYAGGELVINDANVTSLAADVFDGLEGKVVTYVDLSSTSIKDMTVDRTVAPFNKIPATAFIYLPAGNRVAEGATNVVIGTVCQNMILYDEPQPFKAAKKFRAVHFELNRDFSDFTDGKYCSIYLPCNLKREVVYEVGTFYEVYDIDDFTFNVRMRQVGDTDYNKPYIYMPSSGTDFISANMVDVRKKTENGSDFPKFEGTYEYKTLKSDNNFTYYCFAAEGEHQGKFVRVNNNVTVNPFRAYIVLENEDESASRSELSIDWGEDGTTVLEPHFIDETEARTSQGWYSLSGMKLKSKPTKKGLYIHNGKKITILK
ncbi:MAG: hypothetical protein IKU49_06285 [Prevotella sp.]|nr:hypothetical protein [Prevotella sp.]